MDTQVSPSTTIISPLMERSIANTLFVLVGPHYTKDIERSWRIGSFWSKPSYQGKSHTLREIAEKNKCLREDLLEVRKTK